MKRLSGFSLMEMMIVLAIVAVVAAASAPMINKKMVQDAANDNPWQVVSKGIVYLGGNNRTVSINNDVPDSAGHPKLYINTPNDTTSHITFGSAGTRLHSLIAGGVNKNIWLTNKTLGTVTNSVAIGTDAEVKGSSSVAIGSGVVAQGSESVIIGSRTSTTSTGSIAIGAQVENNPNAVAIGNGSFTGTNAISIGTLANASQDSVAIGYDAQATDKGSVAIGNGAKAKSSGSIAIGAGVESNMSNTIVLGDAGSTVHIPGNLIVDRVTVLGREDGGRAILRGSASSNVGGLHMFWGGQGNEHDWHGEDSTEDLYIGSFKVRGYFSDRRLKNVGKEFKGGLAEIKKLELFNYTFKDDKDKTPRVGVMAQDLKKIFPDAVTKGDDGYLRIRLEDMFYAVINAVKELDAILTGHDKRIKELEKQNQELLKRIEALEKVK